MNQIEQTSADKVISGLEKLATKLGVASEHLWGVLIAQARVEFWRWVTDMGLLIVLTTGYVFFARWAVPRLNRNADNEFVAAGRGLAVVGGATLLAFAWIAEIVGASNQLTLLLNPEYWALQRVMEAMK